MLNENYRDVFYQKGDTPVFCYRSGLMVYEETLINGLLVSSGWNAAGYPLNVLSNCPSRFRYDSLFEPYSFNIEIDGQSIAIGLEFADFEVRENDGITEAVLTLNSTVKPVRLRIHTLLDGTQMFSRFIEIENLSDEYLNVSRLVLLGGGIEKMDKRDLTPCNDSGKYYSLGYFDSTRWGREGEFAWHDLRPGSVSVDSRFGAGRFRHPVIFIENKLLGTVYFSQLAWSGGCRYTVDYSSSSESDETTLSFKAEVTGYNPMLVLRPREAFTLPEVHMGVISGGLDDAVNEMHAHTRKSVLNMPEADPSACLVGSGMGAEHDMSVETSKSFIRQFAQMGAEIFIIDAGWECPPAPQIDWGGYNGINVPDPDRYPNGISELSDYCHKNGMKFAMWIEIERLGCKSPVFEQHPEWRARDIYSKQDGGYLDMTNPEAAQWAENELARMITQFGLDLLRVDYNVGEKSYFLMRDTGSGRKECLSMRQFNAVYNMYRNLKKRFPDVIFENCAGGGGRTDLGMMKAFNHTWVSDWQKAPRSVTITNGMTMALPPERVDRLFAGMGCHTTGSFALHMRNTMLGHMSLNVISPAAAQINPVQMEFICHSVKLYKDFIREFLPSSKIYHHTPECGSLNEDLCVIEISSQDGKKGAVVASTLTNASGGEYRIYPKGIKAQFTYKVYLDNSRSSFTATGSEIINCGISVGLQASLASELILLDAQQ